MSEGLFRCGAHGVYFDNKVGAGDMFIAKYIKCPENEKSRNVMLRGNVLTICGA